MPGTTRFSLTAEDYVAANRLHATRALYRGKLIKLALILGAFYTVLVFFILGQWTWRYVAIAAGLGVAVGIALVFGIVAINHFLIPRRSRRIHAQQKSLHEEFEFSWDEAGFDLSAPSARSRHLWADFRQWADGPDGFILYQSDALFNMLPKRAFSADALTDIRERLTQAGVRQLAGWR